MSALLAIGFTSTLMHYYFDGFIWKIRHKQNREALAMTQPIDGAEEKATTQSSTTQSWWAAAKKTGFGAMALRQVAYFGIPMAMLTTGAIAAWSSPAPNYLQHMYAAQSLSEQGRGADAQQEARLAYADMNTQLPFAQKMVELERTPARQSELAFLIYNQSLYQNMVMPQLGGRQVDAGDRAAHKENIRTAVSLLTQALNSDASIAHPGRERLTRDEARAILANWRAKLL
jgi:hypothetical protein